jgi:hypothetical protein
MANLTLKKKVRYFPSIPGNLELPEAERFHLVVMSGLPKVVLEQVVTDATEAAQRVDVTALTEALSPAVSLGAVSLELDGVEVQTVGDYLTALAGQSGQPLLFELVQRVVELNSFSGARAVFSAPPSGGTAGTAALSTGQASGQTASP